MHFDRARGVGPVGAMALLCLLGFFPVEALPGVPRPVGYVNDFADILGSRAERFIENVAAEVKAATGAEIVVATVETTEGVEIEPYSVQVFMDWGIGEAGKDNGVLIVVAARDRKVWIKTGYGLEGAIPDAIAHRIYRDILRPGFREGKYDEALVTAVKAIADRIMAEAGKELASGDSIPHEYLLHADSDKSSVMIGIMVLVLIILVLSVMMARRQGLGIGRRGGFWIGGFGGGGSFGGFGGGFGGFGGGSCGGGGAGGGW